MPLHIGSVIKTYCESRFISVKQLCNLMGVKPISVYHIFKASDLRAGAILRVSNALKHDFFQYYQANIESDPRKKITELSQQLQDLTKSNEALKNENLILKTENDLMKKIVKAV